MYRFLTDLHETGDIFIISMIFKNFQPKQNVIPTLLIRCVFTCDRSYMTNFQMQTQTPETNMIFMPVCLHCSSTMLIFLKIQIWIFHKTSVSLWQRFEHQSVYLTLQKKKKLHVFSILKVFAQDAVKMTSMKIQIPKLHRNMVSLLCVSAYEASKMTFVKMQIH